MVIDWCSLVRLFSAFYYLVVSAVRFEKKGEDLYKLYTHYPGQFSYFLVPDIVKVVISSLCSVFELNIVRDLVILIKWSKRATSMPSLTLQLLWFFQMQLLIVCFLLNTSFTQLRYSLEVSCVPLSTICSQNWAIILHVEWTHLCPHDIPGCVIHCKINKAPAHRYQARET